MITQPSAVFNSLKRRAVTKHGRISSCRFIRLKRSGKACVLQCCQHSFAMKCLGKHSDVSATIHRTRTIHSLVVLCMNEISTVSLIGQVIPSDKSYVVVRNSCYIQNYMVLGMDSRLYTSKQVNDRFQPGTTCLFQRQVCEKTRDSY